jgi:protein-tyrosine phosphatase
MRTDLHWIPGLAEGRLAIMPRPRGGDWLADEVRSWRLAGVDVVVSLLTPDEVASLELAEEERLCEANGIHFVSFPITDRSIPPSKSAAQELVTRLAKNFAAGKKIAVHCRQGIGRTGLIAASLLVHLGLDSDEAIQQISAARGCPVPETSEQKLWITTFAGDPRSLLAK